MGGNIRIGSIRGIPLYISTSWIIVFVLFLWTFAASYFPGRYPNWSGTAYFSAALVTVVLFFASVVAHELGHATIAARTGIKTRRIVLLPIGGVAEIEREAEKPSEEFAIAVAGPITSAILGAAFLALSALAGQINEPLGAITSYLGLTNLYLAVFNLIPGFPMDGGRVLRAAVWAATKSYARATRVAVAVGSVVAYIFIALGISLVFGIGPLAPSLANGLVLAFIGWFVLSSAQATVQNLGVQQNFTGISVGQVMSDSPQTVEANTPLAAVVQNVFLAHNVRAAAVTQGGQFAGFLSVTDVMRVPQEQWGSVLAGMVMVPRGRVVTAAPNEPILQVVARMSQRDLNQVPVLANEQIVGLLSRGDFVRYMQLRQLLHIPAPNDDRPPRGVTENVPQ